MSYFLKKTHTKKGCYLQIYESFRHPETRQPCNRSWKTLGYVQDLITDEIPDPIAFYKQEVDRINSERKEQKRQEKERQVDETPLRNLGFFALAGIFQALHLETEICRIQETDTLPFSLYDCLCNLVYERALYPLRLQDAYAPMHIPFWQAKAWSREQKPLALQCMGRHFESILHHIQAHQNIICPLSAPAFLYTALLDGPDPGGYTYIKADILLDARGIPQDLKPQFFSFSHTACLFDRHMQQGILPDLENTIYTADANKDCCTPWRQALAAGYPYLQKLEIDSLPEEIQAWIYDENGYADLKDSREQMGMQYKSRLQPAEYMTEDGNEY